MLHRDTRPSAGLWLGESMPPCRLRRRKFDYEMVHSEVYLNKYVVSIAPFSTPPFRKLLFSACFRFLIFHPFFQGGGQLTPFVRMCGRPCLDTSTGLDAGFTFIPARCGCCVTASSIVCPIITSTDRVPLSPAGRHTFIRRWSVSPARPCSSIVSVVVACRRQFRLVRRIIALIFHLKL